MYTSKIFLDDVREAQAGWYRVYTAEDCIIALQFSRGKVTRLSLDHDLGGNMCSGYKVTCFLEEEARNGRLWCNLYNTTVHSSNPPGRRKMESSLQTARRFAALLKAT